MTKNLDSVPEGWEGCELTLGARIGYLTIGNGINLLSIIGSIPLDAIGMPLNYIFGKDNDSMTQYYFNSIIDYTNFAIKGKFPEK